MNHGKECQVKEFIADVGRFKVFILWAVVWRFLLGMVHSVEFWVGAIPHRKQL